LSLKTAFTVSAALPRLESKSATADRRRNSGSLLFMTEQSTDELRLRATEAKMQRALGLQEQPSSAPDRMPPSPANTGAPHPHRRHHFVRDGEVPISLVHHDDGAGTNKLDGARRALREQTSAREHAEQLLQEAHATIQALETQLAHERIAKEEAVRQVENERQRVVDELAAERVARQQAEQERDEATTGRQEAEERLREIMAAHVTQKPATAPQTAKRGQRDGKTGATDQRLDRSPEVSDTMLADGAAPVTQTRRRGRPPKLRETELDVVEWWKPGWKERFR